MKVNILLDGITKKPLGLFLIAQNSDDYNWLSTYKDKLREIFDIEDSPFGDDEIKLKPKTTLPGTN